MYIKIYSVYPKQLEEGSSINVDFRSPFVKQIIASTTFLEWCSNKFASSILQTLTYNHLEDEQREWRLLRNITIRQKTANPIETNCK